MKKNRFPPLKLTIPGRLRPHIMNSFASHMGYTEQQTVIYLLQKALEDEMSRRTVEKLKETREFLGAKR